MKMIIELQGVVLETYIGPVADIWDNPTVYGEHDASPN